MPNKLTYQQALKVYNKRDPEMTCIPKKGSKDHLVILEIMKTGIDPLTATGPKPKEKEKKDTSESNKELRNRLLLIRSKLKLRATKLIKKIKKLPSGDNKTEQVAKARKLVKKMADAEKRIEKISGKVVGKPKGTTKRTTAELLNTVNKSLGLPETEKVPKSKPLEPRSAEATRLPLATKSKPLEPPTDDDTDIEIADIEIVERELTTREKKESKLRSSVISLTNQVKKLIVDVKSLPSGSSARKKKLKETREKNAELRDAETKLKKFKASKDQVKKESPTEELTFDEEEALISRGTVAEPDELDEPVPEMTKALSVFNNTDKYHFYVVGFNTKLLSTSNDYDDAYDKAIKMIDNMELKDDDRIVYAELNNTSNEEHKLSFFVSVNKMRSNKKLKQLNLYEVFVDDEYIKNNKKIEQRVIKDMVDAPRIGRLKDDEIVILSDLSHDTNTTGFSSIIKSRSKKKIPKREADKMNDRIDIVKLINRYHYYIVKDKKIVKLASSNSRKEAKSELFKTGDNLMGRNLIAVSILSVPYNLLRSSAESAISAFAGPIAIHLHQVKVGGDNFLYYTNKLSARLSVTKGYINTFGDIDPNDIKRIVKKYLLNRIASGLFAIVVLDENKNIGTKSKEKQRYSQLTDHIDIYNKTPKDIKLKLSTLV